MASLLSSENVIDYIVPVLWMMACLYLMGHIQIVTEFGCGGTQYIKNYPVLVY